MANPLRTPFGGRCYSAVVAEVSILLTVHGKNAPVDMRVTLPSPATTVGELSAAIGFDGEALLVDGRRVPPHVPVGEARIWDGAEIGLAESDAEDDVDEVEPIVSLDQVAGLSSGGSVELPAGRYRFGESETISGALEMGDVAVAAFELDVSSDGVVVVHPFGNVRLNGRRLQTPAIVGERVISVGSAQFAVTAVAPSHRRTLPSRAFHRTPRRVSPAPDVVLVTPARPSAIMRRPRLSWVMMFAPVPIAAFMAYFYNPRFAIFALMGPIMVLGRWFDGKRQNRIDTERYNAELIDVKFRFGEQLDSLIETEAEHDRTSNPSPAALLRRIRTLDSRLWERRPGHDDFANVAIGWADRPWEPTLGNGNQLDEVFFGVAKQRENVPSVPITADLIAGPLGIVGSRAASMAVVRAVVTSCVALSGPSDIPITLVTSPERAAEWDWMKWLPHLGRPPRIATTTHQLETLVEQQSVVHEPSAFGKEPPPRPIPVFIVDELSMLQAQASSLRRALAAGHGVSAVIIAEDPDQLPASCASILELGDDGTGTFTDIHSQRVVADLTPVGASHAVAADIARSMAWLSDPDSLAPGGDLPDKVLLPELLDGIEPEDMARRWQAGGSDPRPAGPIGVSELGAVLVDFIDDGPHALLAGTTGAGKSEFLRSLVAGMAARVSADHLNFVLVDYKGGGAFDVCGDLPHTVAVVTDLDGHLAARALRSMQAELRYREVMFREADAHDMPAYRAAGHSMPRLVVIVDEFATLAAELPEFLDALVDIAQRGRSLGIHLLLATQRPAGVLDAKIRANTNLRVSLRVQDDNDSLDVIGIADAARLGRSDVGRGFVRLGASEVIPFQAAYAGGVTVDEDKRFVKVESFHFGPQPAAPVRPPSPKSRADEGEASSTESLEPATDLERIVANIEAAHRSGGYAEPRKPWLPALAETVGLADIGIDLRADNLGSVTLGIADIPSEQAQVPVEYSLAEGHLLLYGVDSATTGNTISHLSISLAERLSVDEFHLYVLDHGFGRLRPLSNLSHCGAHVMADDFDNVRRMLDILEGIVATQRDAAADGRLEAQPWVLLAADGLGALYDSANEAANPELPSRLNRLIRDSSSLRVRLIGAGTHDRAIPMRIANQVPAKIVHRLGDPASYTTFGLRAKEVPALGGHQAIDLRTGHVGVIATAGDGDVPGAVARINDSLGVAQRRPARIRVVGTTVERSELDGEGALDKGRLTLPFGLRPNDLETARLVIDDSMLIAGPPGSGKTSTIVSIVEEVARLDADVTVVAVVEDDHPLASHPGVDIVVDPAAEPAEGEELLAAVDGRLELIVVDDCDRVEGPITAALERRISAAGRGTWVVAAARNEAVKDLTSWVKALRGVRTGIVLTPAPTDGDILKVMLPIRTPTRFPEGRGFLVMGGVAELVHVTTPMGGSASTGTIAQPSRA